MRIYGLIIIVTSVVLFWGDYMLMAQGYEKETILFALISQVGGLTAITIWALPFFAGLFIIIASSPRTSRKE